MLASLQRTTAADRCWDYGALRTDDAGSLVVSFGEEKNSSEVGREVLRTKYSALFIPDIFSLYSWLKFFPFPRRPLGSFVRGKYTMNTSMLAP